MVHGCHHWVQRNELGKLPFIYHGRKFENIHFTLTQRASLITLFLNLLGVYPDR